MCPNILCPYYRTLIFVDENVHKNE